MASDRCSLCGLNYPVTGYQPGKCKIHEDEQLSRIQADPDPDWEIRAKKLKERLDFEAEAREAVQPVEGKIVTADDQLWISTWDVASSVRHQLNEGTLIQVGKQVFEILHYDYDGRRYLVRAFSMELTDDDLARLAGGD